MNDPVLIGIFGGLFLAFLLLAVALGGGVGGRFRKRIEAVRARAALHAAQDGDGSFSVLAGEKPESGLEKLLASLLPRREQLKLRLQRAGLDMSLGRYAAICVGSGVTGAIAVKVLFGFSFLIAGLAGVAFGLMLPHMAVSHMISRRETKFLQLFPEAIDLMVRGLKSGLPISETIVNAGDEMPEPVGGEFHQIADEVRLGATLDEALWDAAKRIGLAEFKFFAISLSVQRETGGNLGETLANLADILRKRLQMKLKVKAMSSEARASAYIIGSLPFIMFGILMLMNPGYVMKLFTDPRGLIMTGVGLGMMGMGILVMFKMVRFEV